MTTRTRRIVAHLALLVRPQLFRWPGREEGLGDPMTGEDAVNEFQEGLIANRNGGGGGGGGAGGAELDEERRRILEEREKWEKEKSEMQVGIISI